MADQWEVEQAIASAVAEALYPQGSGEASALGTVCRVYRGWPVSASLEADLVRGVAHVTVQPVKGSIKDTTRFSSEWQGEVAPCPLIAEAEGVRVRFSGRAGPGMVAGVRVDRASLRVAGSGSLNARVVAAVLAELVRADRPAELSGASVVFPGGEGVLARAVLDGHGGARAATAGGGLPVTAWVSIAGGAGPGCGTRRSIDGGVVFLDVGGWGCRVQSAGGGETADEGAAVRAWRRELLYRVEYPTVQTMDLPSMLFGSGSVNGAGYLGLV